MTYKMLSEKKLSQAGQKMTKFWYKSFYIFGITQTHRTVWNMKKRHQYIIY